MKVRLAPWILPLLCLSSAGAATTFTGGATDNLWSNPNWSNNVPNVGNEGTLNTDAAMTTNFRPSGAGNIVVNHTAGTVTPSGSWVFWNDDASGDLLWNVNGGSFSNVSYVRWGIGADKGTLNFNSGTVSFNSGNSRLATGGVGGTLNINGGTFNNGGYFIAQEGVVNLNGGSLTTGHTHLWANNGGTVNIGGSFTVDSWLNNNNVLNISGTGGNFNFNSGWTGTLPDGNLSTTWTDTDWINRMTAVGATFDGTPVDGTNFGDFFLVDANGTLSAIPEPGSVGLFGIACLGLLIRRKRA